MQGRVVGMLPTEVPVGVEASEPVDCATNLPGSTKAPNPNASGPGPGRMVYPEVGHNLRVLFLAQFW